MKNQIIAEIFEEIADGLEFLGENPFKINAYRKAARILTDLTEEIAVVAGEGRLRKLPGVGEAIAKKIDEYLGTGRMSKHEEVVREVPPDLLDLLRIQGLGPKTLKLAHDRLDLKDLDDLKRLIGDGSLASLPGLGEKKVENIARGIEWFERSRGRFSLGETLPIVEEIIEQLEGVSGLTKIGPAGSLRRMRETVGDIDILAAGRDRAAVIERFVRLPQVRDVLAAGETKGAVIVAGGLQVDLRVVDEACYGAALQYFTGSKEHNVRLREIARGLGLKVSEYGVFQDEELVAGRTEEEVYGALGLPWIPPEMREDRGELEAAAARTLPCPVAYGDVRGDLHVHSAYSDGTATIAEVARAAEARGYEYVAVCDHSSSVRWAGGLSAERLSEKIHEIRALNENLKNISVLAGAEVDILSDGTLDYPDDLLEKLDVVVAAVHQGFRQRVTERICAAMANPHVHIIAHPTGRLISSREGYEVDMETVMAEAARTGTALELNAYFDRLDLNDVFCRRAKELGVRVAIDTDAHHPDQLAMMRLGIGTARRGWLEKADVLNTYPIDRLFEALSHKANTV